MRLHCIGLLIMCTLIAIVPANAHHSWVVGYQANTFVEKEGVVKEIWFRSPHTRILIEVATEDGTIELWEGETWPSPVLIRRGLAYDKVKVGDTIIMKGERAKGERLGLHIQSISEPAEGWDLWIGLGTRDNPSLGR